MRKIRKSLFPMVIQTKHLTKRGNIVTEYSLVTDPKKLPMGGFNVIVTKVKV